MTFRYVFAEEVGNLDLSPGGSICFKSTPVTLDSVDEGDALILLRRDLGRGGVEIAKGTM